MGGQLTVHLHLLLCGPIGAEGPVIMVVVVIYIGPASKQGGIDTASRPFSELTPYIAGEYSQDYANRYRRMYMLWREAAYSDHRIDDEAKGRMEDFLKETTEMIRSKLTFTEKLRVMLKYSL